MNVKGSTKKNYLERINVVVNYINNHLGDEIDLEYLAGLGNYSPYHFHRIMRAYLGESLVAYVIRLRLETATTLLRYSDLPVSDVASKVGYDNLPSFSKAFKRRFGCSAVEFRQNKNAEFSINKTMLKQKGMETLKQTEPEIREAMPRKVIYAQERGDYYTSASKAWETVCRFATEKGLWNCSAEMIGISHDDPTLTDPEKLRYDACVTIVRDVDPEGEIGVRELQGGKYAVFTHLGNYEKLIDSYSYIFADWLINSKYELRESPCLEKYLNDPATTRPEDLLTEIWVPLL